MNIEIMHSGANMVCHILQGIILRYLDIDEVNCTHEKGDIIVHPLNMEAFWIRMLDSWDLRDTYGTLVVGLSACLSHVLLFPFVQTSMNIDSMTGQ